MRFAANFIQVSTALLHLTEPNILFYKSWLSLLQTGTHHEAMVISSKHPTGSNSASTILCDRTEEKTLPVC